MTTIELITNDFSVRNVAMNATPRESIGDLEAPPFRPANGEIIQVLMEHYDESEEVVADWLQTMFSEVSA